MATTKKRNSSVVHMLVAMLVLFVPVVLVTQLFTRNPEPPITPACNVGCRLTLTCARESTDGAMPPSVTP